MRWPVDKPIVISQGVTPTHVALDFVKPRGTKVKAAVNGTVIRARYGKIEGNYVIIREDKSDHWEYYTGHHDKLYVKAGQKVKEGQTIATIGSTGKATGPHTHFQVRRFNFGVLLNPYYVWNKRHPVISTVKPKPLGTVYTVRSGDTLGAIATKYHTTVAALQKLNGIKNANLVYVGQVIKLK